MKFELPSIRIFSPAQKNQLST